MGFEMNKSEISVNQVRSVMGKKKNNWQRAKYKEIKKKWNWIRERNGKKDISLSTV